MLRSAGLSHEITKARISRIKALYEGVDCYIQLLTEKKQFQRQGAEKEISQDKRIYRLGNENIDRIID